LDELSPESGDGHIKDLADRVRAIEAQHNGVSGQHVTTTAIDAELKNINSTDGQEETEK